jgi:protein TonB
MDAMPGPAHDENRCIAVGVVASVALHAAVLALAPRVAHQDRFEPPRVLSVVLVDPVALPAIEAAPPPPPPAAKRPAVRPAPRPAPAPPPDRRAAPQPVPTAPAEPGPVPERFDAPNAERPAMPTAPLSVPAATVAAAPRETASPPDFRAAYLRNPPPAYPAAARRNGEEGTVTLRVLVGTEGAPREVTLERSSGSPVLDAAALATVKHWRFSPARRGGEALEARVLVPIVFRLEPRG